jgi:hypothetical protein
MINKLKNEDKVKARARRRSWAIIAAVAGAIALLLLGTGFYTQFLFAPHATEVCKSMYDETHGIRIVNSTRAVKSENRIEWTGDNWETTREIMHYYILPRQAQSDCEDITFLDAESALVNVLSVNWIFVSEPEKIYDIKDLIKARPDYECSVGDITLDGDMGEFMLECSYMQNKVRRLVFKQYKTSDGGNTWASWD